MYTFILLTVLANGTIHTQPIGYYNTAAECSKAQEAAEKEAKDIILVSSCLARKNTGSTTVIRVTSK